MTSPAIPANALSTAETVASAPILFAFVIGSIPVLLPLLLYRWIMRRT